MCTFQNAWAGQCKNVGDPFCHDHEGVKCVSYGEQATHMCEETGQLVCGAALCDLCEHFIFPDGTNGGVGFNERECVKIEDQKYTPWFVRVDDLNP